MSGRPRGPLAGLLRRVVVAASDARFEAFTSAGKSRRRIREWAELEFKALAASGPDEHRGYTQIPNLAVDRMRDAELSGGAYAIALHLLASLRRRHPAAAGPADRYVIASTGSWTTDEVADRVGCHPKTVARTIDRLEEQGLLFVLARTAPRVTPARRLICLLPLFRTDAESLLASTSSETRSILGLRTDPLPAEDESVPSGDGSAPSAGDEPVRSLSLGVTESGYGDTTPQRLPPKTNKEAERAWEGAAASGGSPSPARGDRATASRADGGRETTSRVARAIDPAESHTAGTATRGEREYEERVEARRRQMLSALAPYVVAEEQARA